MIYFRDIPFGSNAAVAYARDLENGIDKRDAKIQELEQKIEKMKCCGNCKHEDSTFNCSLDEYCQDKDKWELKQ